MTQNFDAWAWKFTTPNQTVGIMAPFHVLSYTGPSGWTMKNSFLVEDGTPWPDATFPPAHSAKNVIWMQDVALAANASIITPWLPSGIGDIAFYARTYASPGTNFFEIQVSTNGTLWEPAVESGYNNDAGDWQQYEYSINDYRAIYLRIIKTDDVGSGSFGGASGQLLGIDDIAITKPYAFVNITNVVTDPPIVYPGASVDMQANIAGFAGASNLTAKLHYSIGSTNSFDNDPIVMTNGIGSFYKTDTQIHALETIGQPVYYYIEVTFNGPSALSPARYPTAGESAPAYYIARATPFLSSFTNMAVTADMATEMLLTDDHEWQGVKTVTNVSNADFRFAANGGTEDWGETDQPFQSLPVFGFAETNTGPSVTNILLGGVSDGHFGLRFNETNLQYSAQQIEYVDFDSWAATSNGIYTNTEGWVIGGGRTTPLADERSFGGAGRSVILPSAGFVGGGSGPTEAWTPSNVAKVAWFDASDTSTVTHAAGKVSQWDDKAGNGFHAIQGSVLNQPTWTTNDSMINNLPSIGDIGASGSIGLDTPELSAKNVYVVCYYKDGVASTFDGYSTLFSGPGANGQYRVMGKQGSSDFIDTSLFNDSGTYKNGSASSSLTGVLPMGPSLFKFKASSGRMQAYALGYNQLSSSRDWQGSYCEWILTDGSEDADTEQMIEGYLAHKWGLKGSLPGAHPYKSEAPMLSTNGVAEEQIGWSHAQWTDDADSGITSAYTYTAAHCFGDNHASVTVNGVTFTSAFADSGSGWSITGGRNNWNGDDDAAVTGASEDLAEEFIYNGKPRTVTFTGLTTGTYYKATLFSAAWEDPLVWPGARWQTFSASGGPSININQDRFGNNNGITISYVYKATATSQTLTITPAGAATFHLYAIANRQVPTVAVGGGGGGGGDEVVSDGPYLVSPYLADGIGEISFWYRNYWDDTNFSAAAMIVQKSADGISNWVTISTDTNVLARDYCYYSTGLFDLENHYLRVVSPKIDGGSDLCIDNFMVAAPGPGVLFSAVSHTPTTPSITNLVDVTATITSTNNAYDIQATLWYRAGTNSDFEAIAMTNADNIYSPIEPIPRGEIGVMQYYIEATFLGLSRGRVTAWYPNNGPFDPISYTNSDSSLIQDFDSWPFTYNITIGLISPYDVNYTDGTDGWSMKKAFLTQNGTPWPDVFPPSLAESTPNVCWLQDYDIKPGAEVRTCELPFGAGGLSLQMLNYAAGINTISIQTSTNGTNWSSGELTIQSTNMVWTGSGPIVLNDHNARFLKIIKTSDSGSDTFGSANGQLLGLDEIEVYHAPATVSITNVITHPGYPSKDENTYVSCTITSSNPDFKAFNISATLWYRIGSSGPYTSIAMSKSGDDFISVSPIPKQPRQTRIEYYIEARFDGYHTIPALNQSPSFYPAGTPSGMTTQYYLAPSDNPSYFYIRDYKSSYDKIAVESNVGTITNTQLIGDYVWQGVHTFYPGESTNVIQWLFSGTQLYTNDATEYATTTNYWGDTNQPSQLLPLSGWATPGSAAPITVTGSFTGQIVFRYDRVNGTYLIVPCVYQNFDEWSTASSEYFVDSLGYLGRSESKNTFNDWPTSQVHVASRASNDREDYEGWTVTNEYYSDESPYPEGDMGFVAASVMIPEEFESNHVCRLQEISIRGRTWPKKSTLTDGLRDLTFSYRWAAATGELSCTWYTPGTSSTNWNHYIAEAALISDDISPDFPYLSMFTRVSDDDNYYECRLQKTRNPTNPAVAGLQLSLWRRENGNIRDLTNSAWFAGSLDNTNLCQLLVTTNNGGSVYLQASSSNILGSVSVDAYDESPGNLKSPGSLGFHGKGCSIIVDDVKVSHANAQAFGNWSETSTGNYTNGGWIVTAGQPTNTSPGLGWCILPQNGFVSSKRRLDSPIGTLSFSYASDSGGSANCVVSASADGTTWTQKDSIPTSNTNWQQHVLTFTVGDDYRYINITNTGSTALRLTDIVMTGATNFYANSFDSAPTINDWQEPSGLSNWVWEATMKTYQRAGFVPPEFTLDIEIAPTNGSTEDTIGGTSQWETVETMQIDNLQWAKKTVPLKKWDKMFVRLNHNGGASSLIVDDLTMSSWRATNFYDSNDWRGSECWISPRESTNDIAIEFWNSKAHANTTNLVPGEWERADLEEQVRTPVLTNGVGSVTLDYKCENGPATMLIELAPGSSTNSFNTRHSVIVNNSSWSNSISYQVSQKGNYVVRVMHDTSKTNKDAILSIDNITVSDCRDQDDTMWRGYNALITHTENQREFQPNFQPEHLVKSCYINNHPTNGTDSANFTEDEGYVESARLDGGIGEISFWYRNWETNGSPASIVYLRAADDVNTAPEDWTVLGTLLGITNTEYMYFKTNYYVTDKHYLRITCATNTSRLCIDNILITEPIGATFDIGDITLHPTVSNEYNVPLDSDDVDVSVKLSNLILSPSNIDLRLYYYIGTNYPDTNWSWGNWPKDNWIAMSTNGQPPNVYRTVSPIPRQPIDEVVQYYIWADYDGLFADLQTPKTQKTFENPSWYDPRDLNYENSCTNPYYFVFSCYPGDVWINEYNVIDMFNPNPTNEYIELCGKMASDIGNWHIQIMNWPVPADDYVITNNVVLNNETNGYGFWLLGSNSVPGIDQSLTNPINENFGIRLTRSMGAYEDSVSNLTDDILQYQSVSFVGTSSVPTGFTWDSNTTYTAGQINQNQGLLPYLTAKELVVTSDQGGANPPKGTNIYPEPILVTCTISNSPITYGTLQTQIVVLGWTGSGNTPVFGAESDTTNTGPFWIKTDSTIAWTWQTNVYLNGSTIGNGSLSTNGWVKQYDNLTVSAQPDTYYAFSYWDGDTNDVPDVTTNTITVTMNEPRQLIAHFVNTDRTLGVDSVTGQGLNPSLGVHTNHNNDILTCIVSNRYVDDGGKTQYVAVGWTATGSVPSIPPEGPATNLYWLHSQTIDSYLGQDGDDWVTAIYRDGGNWTIDPLCSNGVSAGDDVMLTNDIVDISIWGQLYWNAQYISVDRGLRIFTVIFNATNLSEATHYVVTHTNLFVVPATNQPPLPSSNYDAEGASSNDWAALLPPTNIAVGLSTGPFNITNNSSITWLWSTNYYLQIATNGSGSVETPGWYSAGTSVTVTAYSDGAAFTQWTGNTNGIGDVTQTQIVFTMTAYRFLTANFGPAYTAQGTPISWLAGYFTNNPTYWDTNDFDHDGRMAWEEYVTGTDPTVTSSVFKVLAIEYGTTSNKIVWYGPSNFNQTTPFGMYRTTHLTNWGSPYTNFTGLRDPYGTGTNTWWDVNIPAETTLYYRPYLSTTNGP